LQDSYSGVQYEQVPLSTVQSTKMQSQICHSSPINH
jgi:hypothetical protein